MSSVPVGVARFSLYHYRVAVLVEHGVAVLIELHLQSACLAFAFFNAGQFGIYQTPVVFNVQRFES